MSQLLLLHWYWCNSSVNWHTGGQCAGQCRFVMDVCDLSVHSLTHSFTKKTMCTQTLGVETFVIFPPHKIELDSELLTCSALKYTSRLREYKLFFHVLLCFVSGSWLCKWAYTPALCRTFSTGLKRKQDVKDDAG